MLNETKDLITKNFLTLMKECDVEVLKKLMVENAVFTQKEIDGIFSTKDARLNKRIFFFNIQKKEQRAFTVLLQCLKQTNQHYIANLLHPSNSSSKVFHPMCEGSETDDNHYINSSVKIQDTSLVKPLNIKVQVSDAFCDTIQPTRNIEFYSTRSKYRGRLLIINNFDFKEKLGGYRNGADVDNANLMTLFNQMGGWNIVTKFNRTAVEMEKIIKDFATDKDNSKYDICFVIIMSHGCEQKNETIIYGTDENYISSSSVVKLFNNEHCYMWRNKPKIFVFQVCRGLELDFSLRHVTETDSLKRKDTQIPFINPPVLMVSQIRNQEDTVVCYSTLPGYKSHRNALLGSWYIEILCEKLMNFAHNTPFDDILMLVDQGLKRRMSEYSSKQTSEHIFRGFNKKLYLHPGIYYGDDAIKKFFTL